MSETTLEGAQPADLPIEEPTKFVRVTDLKTALARVQRGTSPPAGGFAAVVIYE